MKWLTGVFSASWAKKFSAVSSMMVVEFCLVWNIIKAGISGEWVTAAIALLAAGGGIYLGGKAINGGPSVPAKEPE